MSPAISLTPESVEALAHRVAELLGSGGAASGLLDASQVADRFGVSRGWVYDHADELGAVRLGDGPKARLRFDSGRVAHALAPKPVPPALAKPKSRRRARSNVELLPIEGER